MKIRCNLDAFNDILDKLNQFTRKYYTKVLIKGLLIFLVIGILVFLAILGIEYFLWLGTTARMVLFFFFVLLTMVLFYKFILVPVLYLFKVKKGITNKEASQLIGKHFPEVSDKLCNLLDLSEDKYQSELLRASIAQRSKELNPVPFTKAVTFRESYGYFRYLLIPVAIVGVLLVSGNFGSFWNSYDRLKNYDLAYAPPAPFHFKLMNKELNVLQDKSYTILVTTEGNVRPDVVFIRVNGKDLMLQKSGNEFSYTFTAPLEDTYFQFFAEQVRSEEYHLEVIKTPSIEDIEIEFSYPAYLNLTNQTLKSTGNAIVPEGTKITWSVKGNNAERIDYIDKDTVEGFSKETDFFHLSKTLYNSLEYQITASNSRLEDYEKLNYQIKIIKDAYPTIKVEQVLDTLRANTSYFIGETSDDHGLEVIELVYYKKGNPDNKEVIVLGNPKVNFEKFYYTFPSGLDVEEGVEYEFYFRSIDNDGIRGGKSTKSRVFSNRILDKDEVHKRELKAQEDIINIMDRSLEKLNAQEKVLKELNKNQKEKKELNFNDQNQIKSFLQKQEVQEEQMQKFSKQLQDNLQKQEGDKELNKLLQERLERQELEARKNQILLEELNKIADKIDKEELSKRLEDLGKKQQSSKRNLEQLVELTKRYYVTEKAAQLANELEKLAEKQEKLADDVPEEKSIKKEQETLKNEFEGLADELKELMKDNDALQKPLRLEIDANKEKGIKNDQKEVLGELQKSIEDQGEFSEGEKQSMEDKIKSKQKAAANKMKKMAEELGNSSMGASDGSAITEDAEMLRQILDNLVIFSFKQEKLLDELEVSDYDITNFSKTVKEQNELRRLFEHVDDSLFSLSLRRAELAEFVNEQIGEVYYNIDKSLESIADNIIYQGVSYQKYVLNASNSLADFLANILDNMQQSLQSGKGSGDGEKGFQLPDIIKGQGEIKDKMGSKGNSPGAQAEGKGNKPEGKSGEQGEGNEGKDGNNSSKGDKQGQKNGSKGQEGREGSGKGPTGNEDDLREIYEIYKEQQLLRQELEKQLQDMIDTDGRKLGEKLIKQMEDFENDLLENGITQRTIDKVNFIEHELLKLENASLTKGKKEERKSNSNERDFQNPLLSKPSFLEEYKNNIEILNRQALPLRQNYQILIRDYFEQYD
ncbi:DUF4175 family protein [Maribacter polysaccharolyticus]|uniref:DUF4175 family protein n=1 Tax=Maribacter polysaccharolyticus TaxID=3020831 RepID=UPI00237F7699|nr:DUF4175 family protein [Maribacter polysaccharolyticus]MDE3742191.1 hypothetical protein [Maribacter polysaccharolyticus]